MMVLLLLCAVFSYSQGDLFTKTSRFSSIIELSIKHSTAIELFLFADDLD